MKPSIYYWLATWAWVEALATGNLIAFGIMAYCLSVAVFKDDRLYCIKTVKRAPRYSGRIVRRDKWRPYIQ